jgi:sulfite exporter TauE/SafE
MIEWSENKLRFTSGIGALCTVGLLSELSRERLPVWIAVAAGLIPLLVFLFIRPGEMRRSIVLPLQIFAALWYLLLAAILTIMFFERGEMTQGWPVYFVGLVIGCLPCLVVLWRVFSPRFDR